VRITIAAACCAAILMAGAARADEVWHHAIITAKSDAGIFYMVGNGFAEKQGLKLEFTQVNNDTIGMKALLAGQLDSFEGSPAGALIGASRGADLKVIGCHWPGLPHGIFARKGIAKPEDLKGKKIAISQPGSMPDQLVRALFAEYKMPTDDVQFANLGSDNDRYKALIAGVVDAAVVSSEYTPIAEKSGVSMIIRGRDVLPDYLRTCIMTSDAALKAHRQAAVRFLAAEISALHYVVAHRDETIALTDKIADIKPDDPRPGFMYDYAVSTKAIDPDVGLPLDKLDWMQQQSIKVGDQPKPVDLAKVADGSIRAEALQLLAQQH
jgi:NitT/TauT family transport system substrate-binding protein